MKHFNLATGIVLVRKSANRSPPGTWGMENVIGTLLELLPDVLVPHSCGTPQHSLLVLLPLHYPRTIKRPHSSRRSHWTNSWATQFDSQPHLHLQPLSSPVPHNSAHQFSSRWWVHLLSNQTHYATYVRSRIGNVQQAAHSLTIRYKYNWIQRRDIWHWSITSGIIMGVPTGFESAILYRSSTLKMYDFWFRAMDFDCPIEFNTKIAICIR